MDDLSYAVLRHRARQWSFTIPSFTASTIERLSNLPSDKVVYTTFAIVDDDTGKRYIQGYVKTTRRVRATALVRIIGLAFYTVCSTADSVASVLTEIAMNDGSEFGDPTAANLAGRRSDLLAFKQDASTGKYSIDQLKVTHPVCLNCPGLLLKYFRESTLSPIKAGKPSGLARKVFISWKKGEMYEASNDELVETR